MPNPPPIDGALLAHLGELARISLPKQRQAELRGKLQQLVAAFSSLGEADFEMCDGDSARQIITPDELREDRAETPPDVSEVLANSPQTAADCFVVARVVEP
jgi:aspartyl/glutamyl-tRNA(Asn/Gln) amidotransferase C subunit